MNKITHFLLTLYVSLTFRSPPAVFVLKSAWQKLEIFMLCFFCGCHMCACSHQHSQQPASHHFPRFSQHAFLLHLALFQRTHRPVVPRVCVC